MVSNFDEKADHGLEMKAELTDTRFELGDPIPVIVTLFNNGTHDVRIWPSLFTVEMIWIRNRNEQVKYHAPLSGSDITQNSTRVVKPGDQVNIELYADADDLKEAEVEFPGRYTIGVRYQGAVTAIFSKGNEPDNKVWLPILKSRSFKISLLPSTSTSRTPSANP